MWDMRELVARAGAQRGMDCGSYNNRGCATTEAQAGTARHIDPFKKLHLSANRILFSLLHVS